MWPTNHCISRIRLPNWDIGWLNLTGVCEGKTQSGEVGRTYFSISGRWGVATCC